jgi:S-adenosylmethionine:tRNA ribosyltransferase-isomerase
MRIEDFDYNLPGELIAQFPSQKREDSRLLILNRKTGEIEHKFFYNLPLYLEKGDCLVLNETKVIKARLYGKRARTGGRVEVFLLKKIDKNRWQTLVRPGRAGKPGKEIIFGEDLSCQTIKIEEDGTRIVKFQYPENSFVSLLEKYGKVPLPPYIKRDSLEMDKHRYQTVYAKTPGAIASPTAGLHFSKRLLQDINKRGIEIVKILLHTGFGTFKKVQSESIEKHKMDSEYYEINRYAAQKINHAKENGKKIFAVGTTTVRTLETAKLGSKIKTSKGWTDLFIYPPYKFGIVQALITNFHLPRTTLLMLVSALAGRELILKAYKEAIERRYKFYSYGDAMLII